MENNIINFAIYLNAKNLADSTIEVYLECYKKFPHTNNKDQLKQNIQALLSQSNRSVVRAFVVSYLDFLEIYDIRIPKSTGRKKRKAMKIPSEEEINDMIAYAYRRNFRHGLMIDLTYKCALRKYEMMHLKVNNFDFKTWGENENEPLILTLDSEIAKGRKERVVLVPQNTAQLLWHFVEREMNQGNIKSMDDRLFKIGKSAYQKALHKISIVKLGKHMNPHMLRHIRSNHLKQQNMNIEDIQQWLGHSSIATTQLYLHQTQEEMLDKFRDLLNKKNKE